MLVVTVSWEMARYCFDAGPSRQQLAEPHSGRTACATIWLSKLFTVYSLLVVISLCKLCSKYSITYTCTGCCLFDLACFFLPSFSHLSLKTCIHVHIFVYAIMVHVWMQNHLYSAPCGSAKLNV